MNKKFDEVAQIVAGVVGVSVEELRNPNSRSVARQIFCHCMHNILVESQVSIARYLCFSNNSPISKALRKLHHDKNARHGHLLQQAIERVAAIAAT